MVRIMLMYYVNCYTFLENPEKDWAMMLEEARGDASRTYIVRLKGLLGENMSVISSYPHRG